MINFLIFPTQLYYNTQHIDNFESKEFSIYLIEEPDISLILIFINLN
jgi:hypothetical protein